MKIPAQEALLDRVIAQIVDAFSKMPSVASIWLGGSLGRGEGDALSDVDIVLIAAPGRVANLVGALRDGLGAAGDVALVHEAPQNAPAEGAHLNVLYGTEPLPFYIDWNVWPSVDERPSDVRVLFEREPVRASDRPFAAVLDDFPRGENTPITERLTAFRVYMTPIVMKNAARRSFDDVARIVGYMQISGDPPTSFEAARDLAASILREAEPDAGARRTIERYIDEVDRVRPDRIRTTERLRLEPIGVRHVDDLWTLHQDDAVAEWWDGTWTREQAQRTASGFGEKWRTDGVHKWIAYDRGSGDLIGRGGLSLVERDGAEVLEIGWSVLGRLWGRGYATEIGREGLSFAFDELGADRVIAFTERHNKRSRAVMERLGMRYIGEFAGEGLVEGRTGVHPDAPFALYEINRAETGR